MDIKENKPVPTSFRIAETTNKKFKDIAQENGLTQEEMLSSLISAYELECAKSLITNREKEIDEFQSLTTRLINIYLNSLELNQNSELRIQEKYSEELIKKAETINMLQENIKKLNIDISEKDTLLKDTLKEHENLKEECKQIKDTLITKENLIKEYKDKIDSLTSLLTEYTDSKNNYDKLKGNLEKEIKEREKLLNEKNNILLEKNILDQQVTDLKFENLNLKKSMEEASKNHTQEIHELKSDYKNLLELKIKEQEIKKIDMQKEIEKISNTLSIEKNNSIEKLKLEYEKKIFELEKDLNKSKTKPKKIKEQ